MLQIKRVNLLLSMICTNITLRFGMFIDTWIVCVFFHYIKIPNYIYYYALIISDLKDFSNLYCIVLNLYVYSH